MDRVDTAMSCSSLLRSSLLPAGATGPTYEAPQTYQALVSVPDPAPVDVEIWRSCTAISGQEKNFTPDYRRISADNGMDHRPLNVHLIVIHGPGHRPHVEEMEPALASMAQIFAQPTVKILLHFTSVYVEDESLLDISEDGDVDELIETPECDGSTTTTYCNSDSYYDAGEKNLLFFMPLYTHEYVAQLTGEQGYVFRLHPLTYR